MMEISMGYALLGVIGTSVFMVYLYYKRKFEYWAKQGISGPSPIPVFGNTLAIFMQPIFQFDMKNVMKFGKIYGYYDKSKPCLAITDPEMIRDVMVKDFHVFPDRRDINNPDPIAKKFMTALKGKEWKRVRAIVTPTFTSKKMKDMFGLMKDCVPALEESLAVNVRDKADKIDLKKLYGCYTLDVIAKCCFATNTNAHKDKESPFIKNADALFRVPLHMIILFFTLPSFVSSLFNITISPTGPMHFFRDVVIHLMQKRKNNNEKRADFLQLLIEAGDNINNNLNENDTSESLHLQEGKEEAAVNAKVFDIKDVKKLTLDENEILAQSIIFFLAGYETTGTLLSFCSYCLALDQDVQEKLYQEMSTAFKSREDISYEVLAKLEYLDAVLSETLRIHTPAVRVERLSNQEYTFADTGITLPKGSSVLIPVYAIHHDPKNFPDPDKFSPERFLPQNRDNIKPYTYLPFGGGPRNCIGMRFALMEAKLSLASVMLKYRFVKSVHTKVPLEYPLGRILLSAKELSVKVEERSP